MLGNFSCFSCHLLNFFKINPFKNFFQEHYQSVKRLGSRSKTIWFQTVCIIYKKTTKFVSSMEKGTISPRSSPTLFAKVQFTARFQVQKGSLKDLKPMQENWNGPLYIIRGVTGQNFQCHCISVSKRILSKDLIAGFRIKKVLTQYSKFSFGEVYRRLYVWKFCFTAKRLLTKASALEYVLSAYFVCCLYPYVLQSTFTMEANTMNPDQTAP